MGDVDGHGGGCIFEGEYHDAVWGTPVVDSEGLFAQLSLCTQQCGVSWRIVWNKRLHYRDAFHHWDMRKVARMSEGDLDALCDKEGPWAGKLIQNRGKLAAIIHNARQCVQIEDSAPGGLAGFLWKFVASPASCGSNLLEVHIAGVDGALSVAPHYVNAASDRHCAAYTESFGVTSEVSGKLADVLKHKGGHAESRSFEAPFKFLGSVTLQAFMLQCGLLNGHAPTCVKNPRYAKHCVAVLSPPKTTQKTKKRSAASVEEPRVARKSRTIASTTDDVWL